MTSMGPTAVRSNSVKSPRTDDELRTRHRYRPAGQCSVVAVLALEVATFKAAIVIV